MEFVFNSDAINLDKFDRELKELLSKYLYINTEGSTIHIIFSESLTQEELTLLDVAIQNHDPIDQLAIEIGYYLKNQGNASSILSEIYALNDDHKNDQLLINHSFIIMLIREGHYGIALSAISEISPSGYIGQNDLDLWVETINKYMD